MPPSKCLKLPLIPFSFSLSFFLPKHSSLSLSLAFYFPRTISPESRSIGWCLCNIAKVNYWLLSFPDWKSAAIPNYRVSHSTLDRTVKWPNDLRQNTVSWMLVAQRVERSHSKQDILGSNPVISKYETKERGQGQRQWWWLSWQSDCFRNQRSTVGIPSLAKFLMNIVYC